MKAKVSLILGLATVSSALAQTTGSTEKNRATRFEVNLGSHSLNSDYTRSKHIVWNPEQEFTSVFTGKDKISGQSQSLAVLRGLGKKGRVWVGLQLGQQTGGRTVSAKGLGVYEYRPEAGGFLIGALPAERVVGEKTYQLTEKTTAWSLGVPLRFDLLNRSLSKKNDKNSFSIFVQATPSFERIQSEGLSSSFRTSGLFGQDENTAEYYLPNENSLWGAGLGGYGVSSKKKIVYKLSGNITAGLEYLRKMLPDAHLSIGAYSGVSAKRNQKDWMKKVTLVPEVGLKAAVIFNKKKAPAKALNI